jgi:MFS family permease
VSVPAALRLLSAVAPDENARRRALAAWSASGAAAGASGFLLGGLVTQVAGWRTVFWLNVPLALLIGLGLRALLPSDRGGRRQRLDIAGAVTLTAAVMAVVAGGSLAERPGALLPGLLLIAAGALLTAAFAALERRVAAPLVPAAAARHPRLRIGAAGSFLNTATTSSAMALATLQLQTGHGTGPAEAGLLLLPFSLCVIAGSTVAARVLRRVHPRTAIGLGLGLIAAGDALLIALAVSLWAVPVGVSVAGLGIGLSSVAATTLGTDVPPDLAGTAAGVLNTAAQLGTALGIAALFVVTQTTNSTSLGWYCAAVIAAAGAVAVSRTRSAGNRAP